MQDTANLDDILADAVDRLPGRQPGPDVEALVAIGRPSAPELGDLPGRRVVRADGRLPRGTPQRALPLGEGVPMRGDRGSLREARLPPDLSQRNSVVHRCHSRGLRAT